MAKNKQIQNNNEVKDKKVRDYKFITIVSLLVAMIITNVFMIYSVISLLSFTMQFVVDTFYINDTSNEYIEEHYDGDGHDHT